MSRTKISSTFSKTDHPPDPINFPAYYPIVDGYNTAKEINSDDVTDKQKDKSPQDSTKQYL
jgi:hypothetical protein